MPKGFVNRLEKAYDYYLKIRMPDGSLPGVNDSDFSYDADSQLKQGLDYFPNRDDYAYVVSKGEKGVEPSFKSLWMPWAGWYVMRSGWDEDALCSFFEVGPFGAGHSHEDKLSLITYGYGNSLLTEGGNYPYDTSEWRKYITSASAHNVTRVDGRYQSRGTRKDEEGVRYSLVPLVNRWMSNDSFDFGEGWYNEGLGEQHDTTVTQYRALLFIKNLCWIMFDVFTPHDNVEHLYDTFFHLDAPNAEVEERTKSVKAVNPGKSVLQIVPLESQGLSVEIIKGQKNPEYQGWTHDATNGINTYKCREIATPIYKRTVAGQWMEAYVLLPVKYGSSPLIKNIRFSNNCYYVSFCDGMELGIDVRMKGNSLHSLAYRLFKDNKIKVVNVF